MLIHRLLDEGHSPWSEQCPPAEVLQGNFAKTQVIWRVEKNEIELSPLTGEPSKSPAQIKFLDYYLLRGAQDRHVPRYEPQGRWVVVHQDHEGGASTERLEPHGAGSGEEIQYSGTTQVVAEDTENGLSHSIGCWPQALTP